jgi:hypothetical protein
LCFLIYTSKLTVGKIARAMTIAGIISSFLFCVQFLDMVTLPNKRFILSEHNIGPCVLCMKKADWILFMI